MDDGNKADAAAADDDDAATREQTQARASSDALREFVAGDVALSRGEPRRAAVTRCARDAASKSKKLKPWQVRVRLINRCVAKQ